MAEICIKHNQGSIFQDQHRFLVVVCGRRFGKTTTLLLKMFQRACQVPGLHGYCAPTYKQAKLIAWKILKAIIPAHYMVGKPNESDLMITLKNGSEIRLFGMDNAENLYGIKLHTGILDEFDQMDPDKIDNVIRPAVSDTMGPLWYCGTPDASRGQIKDLFNKVRVDQKDGKRLDWNTYHFQSIDGGYIDKAEIASAKEELDERTYRQQYEATFETAEGKVYYSFDFDNCVLSDIAYNPRLPVCMCWDFNVDPFCISFAQKLPIVNHETRKTNYDIHVFDELVIRNSNTPEMCREALKRPWMTNHSAGLNIYGDASGNSRSTKSSLSDYQIIQDLLGHAPGFDMRIKDSNPLVKDRINAVNSKIKSYDGKYHLFIHPKCKTIIKDLMDVQRKPGTNDLDKSNQELTHASDGIGYFVEYEFPVVKGYLN